MNERIKELERLATTVVEGWSDENGTTRYYEFNREKFAELLVRECMQVARAGVEFGPSMEEAVYTYFGVKE